jgi:hypothetical protein
MYRNNNALYVQKNKCLSGYEEVIFMRLWLRNANIAGKFALPVKILKLYDTQKNILEY